MAVTEWRYTKSLAETIERISEPHVKRALKELQASDHKEEVISFFLHYANRYM